MDYDKCIQNSHNKLKTTWYIIKEEVGVNISKVEITSVIVDGKKVSSQQDIACEFNKYFANFADKIKRQINNNDVTVNDFNNVGSYIDFMFQAFANPYQTTSNCSTKKEIENIISSLKSKNSRTYDEISPIILKIRSPFIILALNYICNKMLRED
jgi:lysophospholipase L1-like esterase